ncbi:hypothetical protein Sru01_30630 [Sphaerisporangium rufum]|uniref:Uncharacterized protein n=1 Tax=Sphaerisporangium rufum TaxID=1381558 RepID=A0A919R1M0_9ACTN|nr:hypothetical protein [Sphaerisporangium rufum]GII78081.1 hypothetical protein Sru01_30630 [Sphaerisporangium rufum]
MRLRLRSIVILTGGAVLATVSYPPAQPVSVRAVHASIDTLRPLTEQEKDLLHDAEKLLTRSCMESRGFKMWIFPRRPTPEDRDFPYVIDDVQWASRHGYGGDIQARRDQVRASDPNRRYFDGLSPARRQSALDALHGSRSAGRIEVKAPNGMIVGRIDDGCVARAQRELYGDLRTWFRVTTVTDMLKGIGQRQVIADAAFTESTKRWSTCMREKGLDYADPHEARSSYATPGNTAPPDESIRAAVAEAGCAASSGLAATARRLDQKYSARLLQAYRNEARTRMLLEFEALKRARSIVDAR